MRHERTSLRLNAANWDGSYARIHRRTAWAALGFSLLLGWCQPGLARGDETVSVAGDTMPDNPSHFRWTVTNHSGSKVVMFRAPRFLSAIAQPPEGWVSELVPGTTDRNGEVLYRASSPGFGIPPGGKMSFDLQDDRRMRVGRTKQPLSVVIARADGTQQSIAGVLCPAEESILVRNLPLLGLAGMFGIFLLVQAARSRRRKAAAADLPG